MSASKGKRSKYLLTIARISVVAIGLVWAALWLADGDRWENLTKTFRRMDVGVFGAALVVFTLGQATIAFRWRLLLRTQSIALALPTAIRLHFLGLFYNNFMPGAVGGDVLRAWYVTKHTDKKFEAVLSVFVDRIVGLLSTLLIAAAFYTLFMRGEAAGLTVSGRNGAVTWLIANRLALALGVGVAVGILCVLLALRPTRIRLMKIGSHLWLHFTAIARRTKEAAIIYCSRPLTIAAVFGLTVLVQIAVITAYWFLGRTLGIAAPAKYYYVCFTLTWVFGAIPVSIGGAVVVETLFVILFVELAGVEAELALALALCQRIIWMVTSLPGAVIHLIGAHLPKEFSIDYEEVME